MGSLGLPEIAFILVLALLIFGPKKLPEIGRTLGKGMAEFRKATNELKRSVNTELALDEVPGPPQLRPRRLEMDTPESAQSAAQSSMELPVEAPPLTEARTRIASNAPVPVAEPDIVPVAVPPEDHHQ